MKTLLITLVVAVMLVSCRQPVAKVTCDFSGWPIDVNQLISRMQTDTGCKIEIQEESKHMLSPTTPSGCVLFVHNLAEDRRDEVLGVAFASINDGLKANGYKILSTAPTSCKTDYRFVYTGTLSHRSITLKGLAAKGGVLLMIGLAEDIP
jgi:hypothetical protein